MNFSVEMSIKRVFSPETNHALSYNEKEIVPLAGFHIRTEIGIDVLIEFDKGVDVLNLRMYGVSALG